jgi:hypothetical protein
MSHIPMTSHVTYPHDVTCHISPWRMLSLYMYEGSQSPDRLFPDIPGPSSLQITNFIFHFQAASAVHSQPGHKEWMNGELSESIWSIKETLKSDPLSDWFSADQILELYPTSLSAKVGMKQLLAYPDVLTIVSIYHDQEIKWVHIEMMTCTVSIV